MAKITREPQKIFCGGLSASGNISVFGSLKAGSPSYSLDPSVLQSSAYELGWADAVVLNQAPAMQDMNALFYISSYQLAYLMQTGVAEWDAATIYYIGSVASDGFGIFYISIADANTGNALSDVTKWRRMVISQATNATNYSLEASVGSSALTVTLKTKAGDALSTGNFASFDFRSSTLTSGIYSTLNVTSALSLVVSSGSTLGTTGGIAANLYMYIANDGGTPHLCISQLRYDDGTVVTTTAEGGAGGADSGLLIYSSSVLTNVPIRLIGRLVSTQASGGTWATVPNVLSTPNVPYAQPLGSVFLYGGNGYGSTATKIRRFSNPSVVGSSLVYVDSATNGMEITVTQTGMYSITLVDTFASAASVGISINASSLTTSIQSITPSQRYAMDSTQGTEYAGCSFTGRLEFGDVIRHHTDGVTPANVDQVMCRVNQIYRL